MITTLISALALKATLHTRPASMSDFDHGAEVRVMRTFDGKLYVGGKFERANRKLANNIAVWDGTAWSTLGKGVDGPVHDICAVGKDIYVCGEFSYVNKGKTDAGTETGRVAKWDGTKWSALAKVPVDREIFALATDGKNLYLGGNFQKINDTTETRSVAKYDGTKITTMGGQFDRGVMNMAWFNGKLYVGGIFKENGDDECLNTAAWDGKAWSEVPGMPSSCYQMRTDGKDLYAAPSAGSVYKLDGAKWTKVVETSGQVFGLHVEEGKLYLGGDFTKVNGKETYQLAIIDGKNTITIPEIRYARHRAIVPFGGAFIVGGNYSDVQGADYLGGMLKWDGKKEIDALTKD
jgi:hypothetical protein